MTIDNETPGRGYDLPDATNKLSEDVVRLISALSQIDADIVALNTALAGKAASSHNHDMSEITGLVAALTAKAAAVHTHAISALTGVSITSPTSGQALVYNGTSWVNATLAVANISGLQATLNSLQAQIDAL